MLCAQGDGAVPVPRSSPSGRFSGFPLRIPTHHQPLTTCKYVLLVLNYLSI